MATVVSHGNQISDLSASLVNTARKDWTIMTTDDSSPSNGPRMSLVAVAATIGETT